MYNIVRSRAYESCAGVEQLSARVDMSGCGDRTGADEPVEGCAEMYLPIYLCIYTYIYMDTYIYIAHWALTGDDGAHLLVSCGDGPVCCA